MILGTDLPARTVGPLLRIILGLCTTLTANAADPEISPQLWLNPGIYSIHFDRSRHFRENNAGFGAEALVAPDHALMAGTFINSQRARTRYGAYQWRPLHWQPADVGVNAGILIGAFDGYPRYRYGGWFIAPVPLLAIEGRYAGANIIVVPTIRGRVDGALAIQFKVRVW